jgi:hypothetical protein
MPASPVADEEFESARKRQNDDDESAPVPNGPASKKPRLSNGTAFDSHAYDGNAMDLDDDQQNGDEPQQHAYPSPEQAPSPIVTTTGPTTGTQVDKVHDLTTETTFLDLSDDPARNASTVLLQCEFSPSDPTLLAAAGTDALARMWTLSRADPGSAAADAADDTPRKPKFAMHHNLLDESMPLSTTTTGLVWSSNGASVAVSSEPNDDGVAKVEFWNPDGMQYASFNSFESPVISLRWNLDNSACLAISPINEGASTVITVMFPAASTHIVYQLPNHSLSEQILDAVWTSNDVFVLCGGETLKAYQVVEGSIGPVKKFETREGHALSKIVYDERSQLLATASDTGNIDVRIPPLFFMPTYKSRSGTLMGSADPSMHTKVSSQL